MFYWEFTAYINDKDNTWEGVGYWRCSRDIVPLREQLEEMAESLYIGLAAHGFTEFTSLEQTLQAVDLSGTHQKRVEAQIYYRLEMLGGRGLTWSKVEVYRGER